jgi:hypothetical protein
MHARVSTLNGKPDKIDASLEGIEGQIDVMKQQDGFKGFTLMVDRSSGKCIGVSFWESEEQMNAAEAGVRGIREQAAADLDAGAPTVELFEVAIDTMA